MVANVVPKAEIEAIRNGRNWREKEEVKGERGEKMEREGGIRGRRWRNLSLVTVKHSGPRF